MSLQISDIFPLIPIGSLAANAIPLLEPHSCDRKLNNATLSVMTEARTIYRKRSSKMSYNFVYRYENLMHWEFSMIESFYRRMRGRYEQFYLVDWSNPYAVQATTSNTVTLDRIDFLTASTGYSGNTLLFYNAHRPGLENKKILTIASSEDFSDYTITFDQSDITDIPAAGAYVYILHAAVFDLDDLQPTRKDVCIQKEIVAIPGYGSNSLFGPIVDVAISFTQLGVVPDPD